MRDEQIDNGIKKMRNSKISICSIVRDCQNSLPHNIKRIENLRKLFLDSEVVLFENDSKDCTLEILRTWCEKSYNIILKTEKYYNSPILENNLCGNPYFSKYRIEKMSSYRNKYLEIINKNDFRRDYVIVIDLDISNFSIKGIAHSFGVKQTWSCITANGTSLSRKFTRQYHDTYALVEKGSNSITQDEPTIMQNRKKFSFLRNGIPLIAVDSAFGGLAIYDWIDLKGKYYSSISNNDPRVQSLCEHISLNNQLVGNIFINPNMKVKSRSLTLGFIAENLQKRFMIM